MRTVQRIYTIIRRRSFFLIVPLALLLAVLFTACGTNTTTGTGSGSGTPPTPTPTTTKGYGAAYGCPSDAVVSTAPTSPNITLKVQNSLTTTTAHIGDVIEIDMPFGIQWGGPKTSQGKLQLQEPAGYAWKASNMCVWQFVAKGTGVTHLDFTGRPICKKDLVCPDYVQSVPFTIDVK